MHGERLREIEGFERGNFGDFVKFEAKRKLYPQNSKLHKPSYDKIRFLKEFYDKKEQNRRSNHLCAALYP